MPELPGALAVQSFKSVVEEEEEVVSEPAEDYGSVNLQLLFPQSPNHQLFDFSPNSEIPVFVTAESDEHFEVHLFYIHESDVNESYLAPMVEYGGEGNASYRTGRYEYFIHQNGAQLTPGFDRSGTYEITARAYPLGQFSEADALFLINTPADILNDPLAFDENNTLPVNKLMGSASSSFEINPFTGSLPPEVTLEEFKYISATSTSVIPLAASGIDPDGSLKGVQFYVNGEAYGDPILRPSGLAQNLATYSLQFNVADRFSGAGLATIFVTGWDNSGNYVVSDHRTISITSGSVAASVHSVSMMQNEDISSGYYYDVINGVITEEPERLNPDTVGNNFLDARVDPSGTGTGAELSAIFDDNGSLTAFQVHQGGSGYDNTTSLKLIPIVRTLAAGMAHSPLLFEYEVQAGDEEIESVSLVVDGQIMEERTESPYTFYIIPTEPKDYLVYALVRDKAGNLSASEETTISVQPFIGGGVSATLVMEDGQSFEADDQMLLTAQVDSQYAVEGVEFFIDMQSVGKITEANGANYQLLVDLGELGMTLGDHQIAVIAHDEMGNQAGTFAPGLTNDPARQNKSFTVHTSQTANPPRISLLSPTEEMRMTLESSIRLQAEAEAFAGNEISKVQFYINQELQTSWMGQLSFEELNAPGYDDLTLILDDGSGRGEVTFVFDTDGMLSNGGGIVDQPIGGSSNKYPTGINFAQ